jgi:hypothetical protein
MRPIFFIFRARKQSRQGATGAGAYFLNEEARERLDGRTGFSDVYPMRTRANRVGRGLRLSEASRRNYHRDSAVQ